MAMEGKSDPEREYHLKFYVIQASLSHPCPTIFKLCLESEVCFFYEEMFLIVGPQNFILNQFFPRYYNFKATERALV